MKPPSPKNASSKNAPWLGAHCEPEPKTSPKSQPDGRDHPVVTSGLFITGTDTDVGKTRVCVAVLRQLVAEGRPVGVYKPVASGVPDGDLLLGDPGALWRAAGCPLTVHHVCPQAFTAAAAPATAARAEGREVDESLLRDGLRGWLDRGGCVVVEGAGGLFSPLGDTALNLDLARDFGFPLVIVDSGRLGAVGRVLATHRAAIAEGLRVAAVVLSHVERLDPSGAADPTSGWSVAETARSEIARRLGSLPVLVLGHGAERIEPVIEWATLR